MTSANVNVRMTEELRRHLLQQIGARGLYENASEYIRDLIRRDIKTQRDAWEWLGKELMPALAAGASQYIAVTANQVIARNKKRRKKDS